MGEELFKHAELYRTDAAQQGVLRAGHQGAPTWDDRLIYVAGRESMTTESERKDDAQAQACSRCGTAFRCGSLAGDARCWCASLPQLPVERLKSGIGCLCPACLAEEIGRAQLK
jgi:hypothetical protein